MAAVTAALNEFTASLANAADGGATLTAIKNAKRAALVSLVRALALYVQAMCNGDIAILKSSGFPTQKPQHEPVGILPAPANLTVSLGVRSGDLDASAAPVPGASIYNWELMAASAPTVVVQTAQTTGAGTTFSGLTPGVAYIARANVVGSAGPSDWTTSAAKMVV